MPRERGLSEEQIRKEQPQSWGKLIALVLIGIYLIAFVLENRKHVSIHFVFFTATVSLIWLIVIGLVIGAVVGALLPQLQRRRRRH
jgi:uncharacterized integral membrane protein